MEGMKVFTQVSLTGASTKASTKASTNDSMEAFMGVMEAFAEVMEASTEAICMEASTKDYTKFFMEDIEDMKASTELTTAKAFTTASKKASTEVNFSKAPRKSLPKVM